MKEKCDITYEGVVESKFEMGSLELGPGEFPIIVFVGLLGQEKNVRIKISALIKLDDHVINELCESLRSALIVTQHREDARA